jgi:SAM-dependent methyltransferase
MTDVWAAGDLYEPYVGRWSRLVAREFLAWLQVPSGAEWVDVGCGTGALTQTIVDLTRPASVRGIDPSAGFIVYASAHVNGAVATFGVGDAQALPEPAASADAVVSALVLNFVPQPRQAVAEMARVARPGGVVASYVWDYSGKMELMRYFWDAAVALDPSARALDEGLRFPLCQPAPLQDLFADAGLANVEARALDVPTTFRDFDDCWSPFLGGQGPAPTYVASLAERRRAALRERLRATLPHDANGAIPLTARAWAVRGYNRPAGSPARRPASSSMPLPTWRSRLTRWKRRSGSEMRTIASSSA